MHVRMRASRTADAVIVLSLGDPSASSTRASEATKFTLLSQLVDALPVCHRDLLEYLLVFWNKVAGRSEENKMNAQVRPLVTQASHQ